MSNPASSTQQDTTVIPPPPSGYQTGNPGGYPAGYAEAYPPAAAPAPDAAAHWYSQFRKQRRRTRILGFTTAMLGLATVMLAGTSWALFRANDLGAQVAAALPGVSGVIGEPGTAPSQPSAEVPAPGSSDQAMADDLAELQQLAAGLKNEDGSINPLAVASLAGKLGTLAQDPQRLNSLIDQAQAQGIIDSQVAGLLRGVLASGLGSPENGSGADGSGEGGSGTNS